MKKTNVILSLALIFLLTRCDSNEKHVQKNPMKINLLHLFFFLVAFMALGQSKYQDIKVNEQRLESRIFELAKFGKNDEGKNYRVAYSPGDIEARAWFMDLMRKAGLEVRIDAAGNIIGTRKGKTASLKPIAFGSHIDMVPDGGNYDGCVGSLGALEVIETLHENGIETRHPLELIIFSDEEGYTIGSTSMAGHSTHDKLNDISQSGHTIAEGLKAIGGNPAALESSKRAIGDIKLFLELHIEQGGILEKENIQIGVVEGIVGIQNWDVTVEGFANHAGTTPMAMRKDALVSASKLIIAVNEVIQSYEGKQVGTVGKIEVEPGAYNVIPGKVVFGLEIRDLSNEKIGMLFREIEKRAVAIAVASGTTITFSKPINQLKSALTDKNIQQKIDRSAKALGLTTKFMPSGAGHDTQEIAMIAPVGMIFIPSKNGISHSPKEFSTSKDMANGTNVLLKTILQVDEE